MADAKPSTPISVLKRRGRWLWVSGIVVLALGLAAAGLVYWLGTRDADLSNDLSMQGFNRAQQRQMGQLYGKSGLLIDEWSDDLKRPGTQAVLILALSAFIAAGSFYFARLLNDDEETN